jgi:hypothetical protein
LQCNDFDLCDNCFGKRSSIHPGHLFKRMEVPENLQITESPINKDEEGGIHEQVTCDFCQTQNIKGKRYKCMTCYNFDLCSECFPKRSNFHSTSHPFKIVSFLKHSTKILKPIQDSIKFPTQPVPVLNVETHFGIVCDHCKEEGFNGKRFKCSNCVDYDLCERCYGNRFQFHEFTHSFKIVKPGESIAPIPKNYNFPRDGFICGTKSNFSQ